MNARIHVGAPRTALRSASSAYLHRLLDKSPSSGSVLEALDGLRGFAVLIVIASHANVLGMRGQGAMGVWLFFILSGFLLTRILLQRLPGSLSARGLAKYFVRRVARILPLYYLTLSLVMVLEGQSAAWLFRHFAFVQADGHFWSIPQEELFYVILPVLVSAVVLLVSILPAVPACWIAVLVALAMTYCLPLITLQGNGKSLPFYGDVFVLGFAFAFLARTERVSAFLASKRLNAPLDAAGVLVIVLLLFTSPEHMRTYRAALGIDVPSFGWSHPTASGLLCAVLLLASLKRGTWVNRAFSARPLRVLGVLSFGLYLFHPMVQEALTHAGLGRTGWIVFAAMLALCLIAALLSEALIERPCMDLGRRIQARISQ